MVEIMMGVEYWGMVVVQIDSKPMKGVVHET
jgi:hypothetical protein